MTYAPPCGDAADAELQILSGDLETFRFVPYARRRRNYCTYAIPVSFYLAVVGAPSYFSVIVAGAVTLTAPAYCQPTALRLEAHVRIARHQLAAPSRVSTRH